MNVPRPSRALLLSWLALIGLLGLTVTLAYQRLGIVNAPVALTIATVKALVVALIFMELRDRRPLMLAFAGAGIFWLGIMLWLASTDFSWRNDFPPRLRTDRVALVINDRPVVVDPGIRTIVQVID